MSFFTEEQLGQNFFGTKKVMDLSTFIGMGVVNLTPDSFSDGGEFNHPEALKNRIEHLLKFNISLLDFGAQSTAPNASLVTEDEEWNRIETLLLPQLLEYKNVANFEVSIDTFRPNVFNKVAIFFREHEIKSSLTWNDISGKMDGDVISILKEYPETKYVFCHNLAATREESHLHMDFAHETSGHPKYIVDYFKDAEFKMVKHNLTDRVLFDPCFGFSKNHEQNLTLIKQLPSMIKKFSVERKWVIGISKKSFLQKNLRNLIGDDKKGLFDATEAIHALCLGYWFKNLEGHKLWFRIHNPLTFEAAKIGASIIN